MSNNNHMDDAVFEMTWTKRSNSGRENVPTPPSMIAEPALSESSSTYSQDATCSGSGALSPKRPDEGYASQGYASQGYASTLCSSRLSEQYPSRPPTVPPIVPTSSHGVQTTFDDPDAISPAPSRNMGTQTSTSHPHTEPTSPASDYDRFLTAATIDAILPSNQRRRNPKMKNRRRSSSSLSAIAPPPNYVALQPERFPHQDMTQAYEAMKTHNSRTQELKKTPQRNYQRHVADLNAWQKFAYVVQRKPCYESPEGCCFRSEERGEDGTGHGHGDGCCTHFGCREVCCCLGARHCDSGACCEGCGCTRCFGWEHGIWSLCDGWFGGWGAGK